ncbi:hypothetical protein GLYMA_03G121700v4 [Glycine max]|nr:hypothetical protein JHK87_007113 [Glycine soja]KRH66679.2 hypothetical protein GLYMA_03G121700v4 [Glycine max]
MLVSHMDLAENNHQPMEALWFTVVVCMVDIIMLLSGQLYLSSELCSETIKLGFLKMSASRR